MAIVTPEQAAIAQAAAIQQAVQASIPAPAATITNAPVVLPNVGAAAPAPEVAPVVVAPAVGNAAAAPVEAGAASSGGEPQAPAPELSKAEKLSKKIEALKDRIQKDSAALITLEAQFGSVDLLESVKAGSVIVARVGRAETAKEVTASVVGVQTLENGDKRFKIYFGEGFDADTVVIQESQIVDVKQV